jgi:hypothetical protein
MSGLPLLGSIKLYLDNHADKRIRSVLGMVPTTEFDEDDVFIVGHPKSGNTWFQNLAAGVIHGVDPEYARDALIADLVPGHRRRYYKRYSKPMCFRSHHLPRPEYRRIVYLLRDGRDVMVSYFHHLQAVRGREVDFLRVVRGDDVIWPYKWHEHVEGWLANPYRAAMMIIKYEDLKTDPVKELRRFCKFGGWERDDSLLSSVAQKGSFEKMLRKEVIQGMDNPNWPRDKLFVRRGEVGSYLDEMPRHILEAFLHEAGDTLRKFGYLI